MKKLLSFLSGAALLFALTACGLSSAEESFVETLKKQGFSVNIDNDDNVSTETEDAEKKKVGNRTVKKGVKILEVRVEPVRGCTLEFERHETGDTSYYWLDELQPADVETPEHPENLTKADAEKLLDDLAKRDDKGLSREFVQAFDRCYKAA